MGVRRYGADFDGVPWVPLGLEDVSKFPALTAELYRRGYTSAQLLKVWWRRSRAVPEYGCVWTPRDEDTHTAPRHSTRLLVRCCVRMRIVRVRIM